MIGLDEKFGRGARDTVKAAALSAVLCAVALAPAAAQTANGPDGGQNGGGETAPAPGQQRTVQIVSGFSTTSVMTWLAGSDLEVGLLQLDDGGVVVAARTKEDFQVPGVDVSLLTFTVNIICEAPGNCSQLVFSSFFDKPQEMGPDAVNAFNQVFPDQKLVMIDEAVILQGWVPATFGITAQQLNYRLGHFIGSAARLRANLASDEPKQSASLPPEAGNMAGSLVDGVRAAVFGQDPGRAGLPQLRMKDRRDLPGRPINR